MKKVKFKFKLLPLVLVGFFVILSCNKDEDPEPAPNPVASFQYEISESNYLEVTFANFSQNTTTYSWNFGDGNSSTEKDPVHTYAGPGTYEIVLTASNADNVNATFKETIELTDPNAALALLAGEESKTWKLFREGTCMSLGPDASNPAGWWSGLSNNGARPCLYHQTFTFHRDGKFVFDDAGMFWGEDAPYAGTALHETCFEAIAANLVNKEGQDISAWLGGTHAYSYDPATNQITLTGNGAWIGIPTLGTSEATIVPVDSKTFTAKITEETGYDLMTITYDYGSNGLWTIIYVNYSNPSLEPDVETVKQEYGEDLDDFAPTRLFNTFASADTSDVQELVPTESEVSLTIGVNDPVDSTAAKVGHYQRNTGLFSDLKFQLPYDCQFTNFDSVSIDVYLPSTNTYSEGGLAKAIQFWIADASQTEQFWNNWVQFDVEAANIELDKWKTYTFHLGDALTRNELDLVGLVVGGSNHAVDGEFYIRNFIFK